jgi:hypothetical protein
LAISNPGLILEVFHEIPDKLSDAVEAEQRFPHATDLRQSVTQLYNTLIENLGVLIPILLRSHPERTGLHASGNSIQGKKMMSFGAASTRYLAPGSALNSALLPQ